MYPYIEKLFQKAYISKKYHLEDMRTFYQRFALEKKLPPIIHIAGTNGKGSVSLKLAYSLAKSGYSTALYTSPHLDSITERIVLNEKQIPLKSLDEIVKRIFQEEEKTECMLSFFEIMTLAFLLFLSEEKVDIAVVETGLGGRLDATNILSPILSIITSIGLDHAEILGNDLDKIAIEKAGIIKKGVPVILGPSAQRKKILKIAQEKKAETVFSPKGNTPFYDSENRAIAKSALVKLQELGFSVKEVDLPVRPSGRFELYKIEEKMVVIDAAHNLPGFYKLSDAISFFFGEKKKRLLFSCTKEKDIPSFLPFLKKMTKIYLFPFQHSRTYPIDKLEQEIKDYSLTYQRFSNLNEAVSSSLKEVKKEELIVYAGSIYPLHEVKKAFLKDQESALLFTPEEDRGVGS